MVGRGFLSFDRTRHSVRDILRVRGGHRTPMNREQAARPTSRFGPATLV